MTERKLKVGDRVKVVKSLTSPADGYIGMEGKLISATQHGSYPYRVHFPVKANMDFSEQELELVLGPQAGDKVRITLERDVYQTTDESATPYVMVGYHPLYLGSAGSIDKVEVIERAKPPIVLPTGKNALIEFPGNYGNPVVAVSTGNPIQPWLATGYGTKWPEEEILRNIEKYPGVYRVIFEGEDD